MPMDLDTLTHALTTPLLEPELSGEQIGRNRMRVIQRLSEVLGNTEIQVWLVEEQAAQIEMRLAYWFPKPHAHDLESLRGHIITEPRCHGTRPKSELRPPASLLIAARAEFERLSNSSELQEFAILNPISQNIGRERSAHPYEVPLAWVFALQRDEFKPSQLAAARAVAFNLAILLEHGRSHRIVEATNACAEVLHEKAPLSQTLERCAQVLIKSCAAEGGGFVGYVNGRCNTIRYATDWYPEEDQRRELETFFESEVTTVPVLREHGISISNARQRHSNKKIGNLLLIPIVGPGLYLDKADFVSILRVDDSLGSECEFHSYALFLTRKRSPEYLGINFSATDKRLCQAVARGLSNAALSNLSEQLFLMQADFFSHLSFTKDIDVSDAIEHIKAIVPSAQSLHQLAVFRNTAEEYEIEYLSQSKQLPQAMQDFILSRSATIYSTRIAERTESIECACYADSFEAPALVFQMTTRYVPLRFYVLQLGSHLIETFRLQLIKHFMRELFHFHRTKDNADERASLLAQIRHAVVDPLAAATNNIDAYQRHIRLFGRTDDGWLRLKANKQIRDLIPQALYLNNQALLFIDTGRFLFSSLTYSQIRFDQYRPKDLLNDVRLSFDYALRERAQAWKLRLVGESNRSGVGDKLLLWMALANLIDNAIKYGHRNTTIEVVLEFAHTNWSFSIENTGDYLDPALVHDIFQPFVRGRAADTSITRRQGTGIGLTASQMILQAHNKKSIIRYTSKRTGEEGTAVTRFMFSLPYKLSKSEQDPV
jgi:signal transduction histidine kinase